ncbi:MAG: L,D-transpeptidase [Rhizobiaceae bacterium]
MFRRSIRFACAVSLALSAALLAGCSATSTVSSTFAAPDAGISNVRVVRERSSSYVDRSADRPSVRDVDYPAIYAARQDGDIAVPAFDYTRMNSKYLRQQVAYYGSEAPGTIVIDARRKHLYLVEPGRKAMRYGIAVGKEGYGWTGSARLQWKQKWPTWTPPKQMIERKPELQKYADGLAGSPQNPLGARAMYLFKNGKDTLYRIHGTDKPFSIGKAASSGCFRMINQDVIDLYARVGVKGAVHVRPQVDPSLVAELTR